MNIDSILDKYNGQIISATEPQKLGFPAELPLNNLTEVIGKHSIGNMYSDAESTLRDILTDGENFVSDYLGTKKGRTCIKFWAYDDKVMFEVYHPSEALEDIIAEKLDFKSLKEFNNLDFDIQYDLAVKTADTLALKHVQQPEIEEGHVFFTECMVLPRSKEVIADIALIIGEIEDDVLEAAGSFETRYSEIIKKYINNELTKEDKNMIKEMIDWSRENIQPVDGKYPVKPAESKSLVSWLKEGFKPEKLDDVKYYEMATKDGRSYGYGFYDKENVIPMTEQEKQEYAEIKQAQAKAYKAQKASKAKKEAAEKSSFQKEIMNAFKNNKPISAVQPDAFEKKPADSKTLRELLNGGLKPVSFDAAHIYEMPSDNTKGYQYYDKENVIPMTEQEKQEYAEIKQEQEKAKKRFHNQALYKVLGATMDIARENKVSLTEVVDGLKNIIEKQIVKNTEKEQSAARSR